MSEEKPSPCQFKKLKLKIRFGNAIGDIDFIWNFRSLPMPGEKIKMIDLPEYTGTEAKRVEKVRIVQCNSIQIAFTRVKMTSRQSGFFRHYTICKANCNVQDLQDTKVCLNASTWINLFLKNSI